MSRENVRFLHSGAETPESIRDWLNDKIESGRVRNVVVVLREEREDPNDDNMDHDWHGNGTRGDLWWLTSWAYRAMQRKWFG